MKEETQESPQRGLIAWFARNSVAANLLMILIIVGGISSVLSIRVQIFPDFDVPGIRVSMAYPGGAPAEIEEAIVIPIEEALEGLDGIARLSSRANESSGELMIEVEQGYDIDKMLDEIQSRVDTVSTFPPGVERPVIRALEAHSPVVSVSLRGDLDDRTFKKLAQQIRDEILALPGVTRANTWGDRPYEIAIEVSETTLREYGLTLGEVAAAVRASSVDMPGGAIRTDTGSIQVRTKEQAYTGLEYGQIVLRSNADGTRLRVSDIATITDGFVESEEFARFDGERAMNIDVQATGDQNVLDIEETVMAYVADKKLRLPESVTIDAWQSAAYYLKAQLDIMLGNMLLGAFLVFLVLATFLRIKVAAWVMVGIPISFLGALWLMPLGPYPVDINMITLFGLILVLGIVVDDAIIIGESVYTEVHERGHSLDNVIAGVHRVAVPATFGVLTTIAAFAPMLLVGGMVAFVFQAICMVVILCLLFSLVESKLILPTHLAHTQFGGEDITVSSSWMDRFQHWVAERLHYVIHFKYKPTLSKAIHNRYTTLSLFVGALLICIGLVAGNIVKTEMLPNVPSDFIMAQLVMEEGASFEARNEALGRMEHAALSLNDEFPDARPIDHIMVSTDGTRGGRLAVELPKIEERTMGPAQIEKLWRERTGTILGAEEIRFFSSTSMGGGSNISLNLTGRDGEQLELAARELELKLAEYDGVFDVNSSYSRGTEEIKLRVKPEAKLLGITANQLGAQVQHAFHGYEAQRILRGRDQMRVMVRYPREERSSTENLRNMRIRTPDGHEVAFEQVAEVTTGLALASIRRENRERTVSVNANVDPAITQSAEVIRDVETNFVSQLLRKYPNVNFKLGQSSEDQAELTKRIGQFFLVALFLIYALLAIPLRSYVQPLMVMAVIPFGLIGAVIGHILFGATISFISVFGLIALAGVIVNDSLILVDFVNRSRREGMGLHDAVINAGTRRFRAILLTTLTTFFGLLPMMFETSMQAQMLIPMAISLSFGIAFGTALTLFMVPCLYLVLEDLQNLVPGRAPADPEPIDQQH